MYVSVWIIEHPTYGFLERIDQDSVVWSNDLSNTILFRSQQLATNQVEKLPLANEVRVTYLAITIQENN